MKKNFILPLMLGLLSVLPLYPASYTLDDLVTAMKSSNSELLSIDEEIYRSHLDTAEAEGAFSPTIDLALSGTYMVNPVIGPVTIDPSAISGLPPEFSMLFSNIDPFSVSLEMDPGMVQGQLTLTQPIFTWGKLSNAVKLRKKSESIVRTGRINRENQLVSELEARLDAIYYLEDIFSHLDEIEEKADALVSGQGFIRHPAVFVCFPDPGEFFLRDNLVIYQPGCPFIFSFRRLICHFGLAYAVSVLDVAGQYGEDRLGLADRCAFEIVPAERNDAVCRGYKGLLVIYCRQYLTSGPDDAGERSRDDGFRGYACCCGLLGRNYDFVSVSGFCGVFFFTVAGASMFFFCVDVVVMAVFVVLAAVPACIA